MTDKGRRHLILSLMAILCGIVAIYYFASKNDIGFNPFRFYYHATEQTGAPNLVTAIYLKYRLYDTLFEALMLAVAVMGVIHFSWGGGNE